mmetsp:Transcript_9272/g.26617  ORF Transcript_9272/g.26617 Transcript_9272/m.26617 type:complete len:108 (+) Transcript_9272:469-792(+)
MWTENDSFVRSIPCKIRMEIFVPSTESMYDLITSLEQTGQWNTLLRRQSDKYSFDSSTSRLKMYPVHGDKIRNCAARRDIADMDSDNKFSLQDDQQRSVREQLHLHS